MKRMIIPILLSLLFLGCFTPGMYMENTSDTGHAAPASAQNPKLYPKFSEFGMEIKSSPLFEGMAETEMVITSREEIKLYSILTRKGLNESLSSYVRVEDNEKGKNWTISVIFPESGEYELELFASLHSSTDNISYETAKISFKAEVDNDSALYFLEEYISGSIQNIRISDINNDIDEKFVLIKESIYTDLSKLKTGTFTENSEIEAYGALIPMSKGSSVTFDNYEARINTIAFFLEKTITMKLGNNSVPFKDGTEFLLGFTTRGYIAEDLVLNIKGNILKCPKGSLLTMEGENINSIELTGIGEFTIGSNSYPCQGIISIYNYEDSFSMSLQTAGDVTITSGDTVLTAPTGSKISIENNIIFSIFFPVEGEIRVGGKTETVEESYFVGFDEEGNFKEIVEY